MNGNGHNGHPLPNAWEWKTVNDLASDIQYGYTQSANDEPVGPKFLRITDIQDGRVDWDSVPYCQCSEQDWPKYKLEVGDIVFARTGATTGKSFLIEQCPDAVFASYLIRLRLGRETNVKYFYYFLQSAEYWAQITSVKKGSAQPGVNATILATLHLPVAPLPEQERIVSRIEELFSDLGAGVAALKRVRAGLKRYKAAVLKAAVEGLLVEQDPSDGLAEQLLPNDESANYVPKTRVGRLWGSGYVPNIESEDRERVPRNWIWVKVKDLGYTLEDAVQVGPMSMQSRDFEREGVPVLNVGCVQWGHLDETKLNYLSEEKASAFARYRIRTGDILFTRSGTVGRSAVAGDKQNGWLMTFHLLRVRPNPAKCLPNYLQMVFEGASHIRKQTKDASIGTTRAGFNTNLLAMLDVPLPPLGEQRRIVAEVERRLSVVRQIEQAVDAGLARAARLRQAVLKTAFEGRL